MKKMIAALFFINILSISAFADFLIEPSLGYGIGSYTYKTNGFGELPGAVSGIGLGAKLGYSFTMFYGALDLGYNMMTIDPDSATSANSDGTQTNIGLTAGVDLALIRAWVGYIFSSTITADGTPTDSEYKGSGFKLGAGYKLIPMVSLNAEYMMFTYDELTPTNALFNEFTTNLILLSVSVPLSI